MPNSSTHITGILLAGGKSQRMGSEKGSIRIGNSLLYQYPLRILEELCDEILISTCNEVTIREKYRNICDEVKGIGPLGGIYSCLKQSSSELNLVISYDMPLVSPSLFTYLIDQRNGYDIVLPAMHEKKPEPSCGIYSRNITGLMDEMIAQKDFALHHLLKRCKSKLVGITNEMDFWLPELFLNINTREDLKRLPEGFGV